MAKLSIFNCIALLACGMSLAHAAGSDPATPLVSQSTIKRLCEILARLDAGDREEVTVSGIYAASFHDAFFYDPEQPLCTVDVEPSTSVDFAPDVIDDTPLDRLIERDGKALVTFEGVLEGPPALGPDDPSLPPLLSAMNRLADSRYGGMPSYRTRLTVKRILRASPVPSHLRYRHLAERPKRPLVTKADLPTYPEAARRAGIAGVVIVDVRADNGTVIAAEVLSGDRLLAAEAVANIKTWNLSPAGAERFTTVYHYELEQRLTGSDLNPRIDLHLPAYVRVVGAAEGW